ncbi:MAG: choice-of-anchor I family protein, partial [Synechococcales bacterium]|nr:choice-of-anchor I family protein [Synechococcales bacterium]
MAVLQKIGGFSGIGSEVSAYDPVSKRLFVVAGTDDTTGPRPLLVLDLSNPTAPTLVTTIPVSAFGGAANSVAVRDGVVAVAIEGTPKTAPGKVVFLNTNGTLLNQVTVGALPDMLTFSPDGKRVLTANEGEPNSYGQPSSIDPVGSVSIIDLSNGVANATVRTAGFESFNSQIADLRGKGVRITGPGATVAQDLEPEYITVTPDGKTAYVTLQENNALAVINIDTATVSKILPLGLKDFSQGLPSLTTYDVTNLPALGTTATVNPSNSTQTAPGQTISLGGFSGLAFDGVAPNGNLRFITHTDRGPNGEPSGSNRPFALPDFQPRLVRLELNRTTGQVTVVEQIGLKKADGSPLTGLPNVQANANGLAYTDEVPVDLFGNRLANDKLGGDFEGIAIAADGTYWLVDEYRPAIYQFDRTGTLLNRLIPTGTATGDGSFGTPVLPAVYAQRRSNRGFEAVAIEGNTLYAFIQSALDNPDSTGDTTSRASRNLRVLALDVTTKQVTGEFVYLLDDISGTGNARTDKLGDAVSLGNGRFLVVERDDRSGTNANKLIYEIDLRGATNINNPANLTRLPIGKTLEQSTVEELSAAGVKTVSKRLVTNAAALGYTGVEKLEGLALVGPNTLAIINDNDFGIGGSSAANGVLGGATVPSAIKLGLLEFNRSNGLDASDTDGSINIRNWPVFGMYQPDAIANFTANGQTYLITANEGDARDYTGFAEEIRVGASGYSLDPTRFPNASTLKANANLGRLTVSRATGDTDGDGDFDRIEMLGARSFTIWDTAGNLVFDTGDQMERITADRVPAIFNSNGTATTLDTRSDNKGPEPEGVAIAVVEGRTFGFIGLERTGGVMVYELTDPTAPVFLQYVNPVGDVGPEVLTVIPAAQSPNGKVLLVSANEVSSTTAIYEFTPPTRRDGTAGNDALFGTSQSDVFLGGAGNDALYGNGGND